MGIRKKFSLQSVNIDINAWNRQMRKDMEEEIKDAGRDWLATVIAIVPVWSRASHATFSHLADAVGFSIPTQPLVAKKDRSGLGRSESSGGLEITKNTFHFTYETSLRYLAFNEFNHAEFPHGGIFSPTGLKTPTPFNFTGKAAEQFKERTPELTNPFNFIKGRKL